jgi:cyanophycinase
MRTSAFGPILFLIVSIQTACQSQEEKAPVVTPTPSPYYSIGITGSAQDVQTTTQQGLVLMGGGTDVDEAIQWMINKSGGGDFVVIRATGSTGYNDYVYTLGGVNSVETLLLDSRSKALTKEVGQRIREAEALFIAGGDQANYVTFWGDTEVSAAINYLIMEKKVPVGGTSAGCAILSQVIFDAKNGSVISSEALTNPYHELVSLSNSFITAPFLENVIADQHYSQRQRKGRHVAFMARMVSDLAITKPKGIGVDERTAVCIDQEGDALVMGSGNAYFLRASDTLPEVCERNQPLTWNHGNQAIAVFSFSGSPTGTAAFNLSAWPDSTPHQYWYVEKGVFNVK